jgi:predicted Zn-dependent peptidase
METRVRFELLIAIALLLAVAWPAATASAQGTADEAEVQMEPFAIYRYTLPNGLRVWVQPRADSESAAALLAVDVGSRSETAANNGASHFVEHMVFTGTERWGEEEVKEIITRRGGKWNGQTDAESTVYWAQVAGSDLDVALDWLAQVVFHPTFPADKVDKERQVIFQEKWGRYGWIINALDSLGFGYELDRDVQRAIFPGSSLGLRIVGEDASLDGLDREALLDYYQRHYAPGNATLIVTGGVDPERVRAAAAELFGEMSAGAPPDEPETPPMPGSGPSRVDVRGPWPTEQVRLLLGARTVGRTHPDRPALAVLAEVLDAQLSEEIRYRQGLVYGVSAYNVTYADTGYLAIDTSSDKKSVEAIRRTAEEAVERIGRGEVDAGAVARARTALQGRWALSMEDNVDRAFWLAAWAAVLRDGEPVPDYQAAIAAVTPEDLTRVVATYWTPERRFSGRHVPAVTVGSGARVLAGGVALVAGVGLVLRMRRRRR